MRSLPIYVNDVASVVRWHRRVQGLGGPGAHCERCGEPHPFALTKGESGDVLCFVCRALERGVPRGAEPAAEGELWQCVVCGFEAPAGLRVGSLFHRHHVLGRAHEPDWVAPLCLNCHAKVTEVQRALGVDLRKQTTHVDTLVNAGASAFAQAGLAWDETPEGTLREQWAHAAPAVLTATVAFVGLWKPELAQSSPWSS